MMIVESMVATSFSSEAVWAQTSARHTVRVRPGRTTRPSARKRSPWAGARRLILNSTARTSVFAGAKLDVAKPDPVDVKGYGAWLKQYEAGLAIQKAATEAIS